jgi:hypothetical protein
MRSLTESALNYVDRRLALNAETFISEAWIRQLDIECQHRTKYVRESVELRRVGLLPADFIPVYAPREFEGRSFT